MTKRSAPTGVGKSASFRGLTFLEVGAVSEKPENIPGNESCGSYGPGHRLHWIQANKSHEPDQPMFKVTVTAVRDDGRVELDGDGGPYTLWFHRPDELRSALRYGGRGEWLPKYHVLYMISIGQFNLSPLTRVAPCVPPARRRAAETTAEFISRAARENHGYTVPMRSLTDPDAIPVGETGQPTSGYLVGYRKPPIRPGEADD